MGINILIELTAANDAHQRVLAASKGMAPFLTDARIRQRLQQITRDHQEAHGCLLKVVEALNAIRR